MRPTDQLPYVEFTPVSGGLPQRVYADAWEHEELSIQTSVVSEPVESGARVTDHMRNEPITLKCRMFFSEVPVRGDLDPTYHPGTVASYPLKALTYPNNTPLLSPGGLTNAVESGIGALASAITGGGADGPTIAQGLQFAAPPGRLREFLQKLIELREAKSLFAVGCSVLRLDDMALTNAGIARTAEDGDSGALDLEFQQLQFVSTETAKALPLPLEPRGQPKKGGSGGNGTEVPAGPQKTGAAAAYDAAKGALTGQ